MSIIDKFDSTQIGDFWENFTILYILSNREKKYFIIENFLESKHCQVRCNSSVTLMNCEELAIREKGEKIFNEFLYSEDDDRKVTALRSLPRLQNMDTSVILSNFLASENSKMQKIN